MHYNKNERNINWVISQKDCYFFRFKATTMSMPTTTTTELPTDLPTMSLQWPNCTFAGEGSGDNPEHCLAFYAEKTSGGELDCCWTADYRSELPPSLQHIVTVHSNGIM